MSGSLLWERFWPWATAAVITAMWYALDVQFPQPADDLLGAAATVASVFASFLGVSEAIIIGLRGGPSYKILERAGYTSLLYGYLRAGIMSSVIFAGLSILGFFVSPEAKAFEVEVYWIFSAAWVFFGASALFTFARITNILFKLLRQP